MWEDHELNTVSRQRQAGDSGFHSPGSNDQHPNRISRAQNGSSSGGQPLAVPRAVILSLFHGNAGAVGLGADLVRNTA